MNKIQIKNQQSQPKVSQLYFTGEHDGCRIALRRFAGFLKNCDVTMLSFKKDNNYTLKSVVKLLQEIELELSANVVPTLTENTFELKRVLEMKNSCQFFISGMKNLWAQIPGITDSNLYTHNGDEKKVVGELIADFRQNFIQPVLWLLAHCKLTVPDGFLRNTDVLSALTVPAAMYVQDMPVRTDRLLQYATEPALPFIKICTLADEYQVQEIVFPKNSELIFYCPQDGRHTLQQVRAGGQCIVLGENINKGDVIYFDQEGRLHW